LLGRIHLPNVMGMSGFVEAGGRSDAAERRRTLLLPQPALEGTLTGQGQLGLSPSQLNADVASSPRWMLLSQGESEVVGRRSDAGPPWTGAIARCQAVRLLAKALQEMTHGAHRQMQVLSQTVSRPAALGQGEETLADGERDSVWHGIPHKKFQSSSHHTRLRHAAKPLCRD